MLISEIFNVTSGQVMSRITTEIDEVEIRKVLLPKAISNGVVMDSELVDNKMKTKLDESKMTMEGDIIVKLSTPYEACVIDSNHVGLVVPSFCAILRLENNQIDKNYAVAYINSKLFVEQVQRMVTGSVTGIMSVGQLKSIDIPNKSIDLQKRIGLEYKKMTTNKMLLEKMIKLQNEKIETMISEGGNND